MSRVPSRDGGGSRGRGVLVVLVVVVALAGIAVPAASFTTADVPRSANVAVANDQDGVLGLDKVANVQQNNVERLVTVTNNFGEGVDMTVALLQNDGDLYYDTDGDGTPENVGDSVTVSLVAGASADVYVEATDNPNTQLPYEVTGGTGDASFSLQRSATIQGGNAGGNGGSGGGTDPGCENGNKKNCN